MTSRVAMTPFNDIIYLKDTKYNIVITMWIELSLYLIYLKKRRGLWKWKMGTADALGWVISLFPSFYYNAVCGRNRNS